MLAMMETADGQLPVAPEPPLLIARRLDGDKVSLAWSASQGEVNGYRIESRVADGAWKEIERWLGPGDGSLTVHLARPSLPTAFRMRAWNDRAVGAYSDEAIASSPRRRSVR